MQQTQGDHQLDQFGNILTVTGLGLDTEISFYTNGHLATRVDDQQDETTAEFLVTRVTDIDGTDFEMYCPDGLPIHYDTNVEGAHLNFGYQFHKISPTSGFTGGTMLTVHTTGFGEAFTLSNLALAYHAGGDNWIDFCFDFEWLDINTGKMTCRHDASIYPTSASYITLRHTWHRNSRFNCWNNNDIDNCHYHAAEKGISIDSANVKGSPTNIISVS